MTKHSLTRALTAPILLLAALAASPAPAPAAAAPVACDVDRSGAVTVADVQWVVRALLGLPQPHDADVDRDSLVGRPDLELVLDGALGRTVDRDGDGLPDAAEAHLGTDPDLADSDGDGVGDGQELLDGTDPLVPGAAFDPWDLWTGETRLRGANIYQRRVYPDLDGTDYIGPGPIGAPFVQADIDRLAALGANLVQVSHPGLFTEDPPYELDPAAEANLDQLLDWIEQAGMFAVISFRTGPGRNEFTFFDNDGWFDPARENSAIWHELAAQEGWAAMWRYAALRYKDRRFVVGYDLMVEPNANGLFDIWEPDEFYALHGGTIHDWNLIHPRVTAAIREVDPQTPIIVSAEAFGAVAWLPWLVPSGHPRVVHAVHNYEPYLYTHQEPPLTRVYPGVFDADWDGVDELVDRDWLDTLLQTVDEYRTEHGIPVTCNEFGPIRWEPGAAAYLSDHLELLEERGLNHVVWAFYPSWEPFSENDDFSFMHGPDPNNHVDVDSDLRTVLETNWALNQDFP